MPKKVLYTSQSCGHCDELKQKIKEKGLKLKGITLIDCDSNSGLCDRRKVRYTPTLEIGTQKITGNDQILKKLA